MVKSKGKIEFIDYIKGISVVMIVAYHLLSLYMQSLPNILKYVANAGSGGTLIFFFASGFVLYLSQSKKEKADYLEFYKKRFVTIYLPYIFVVVVSFFVPFVDGGSNRIVALLSHVFQFRCVSTEYFSTLGSHFWYLSTLFQFYLVFFPAYYALKKIGEKKFLALSVAISVIYVSILGIFHQESNSVLIRLFLKYFVEFGFGMVMASYYKKGKVNIQSKWLILTSIIGIGIFGVTSMTPVGRLFNDIPEFFGLLSAMLLLYKWNILRTNKLFVSLNKISFEVYLVHMLILDVVFHFAKGTLKGDLLCAVVALIAIGTIGYLYNIVVKKVNRTLLK